MITHTAEIGFKNNSLYFNSSNNGILQDVTNEPRAQVIPITDLIKNHSPVYKNLYIIKHPIIIVMARSEDPDIDGIYICKNNIAVIFISVDMKYTWKGFN